MSETIQTAAMLTDLALVSGGGGEREMAGCEHCLNGVPILHRGSRKVLIRHNEDKDGGYTGFMMEMWWCTPGGHRHMEWMPIVACPVCGADLRGVVK